MINTQYTLSDLYYCFKKYYKSIFIRSYPQIAFSSMHQSISSSNEPALKCTLDEKKEEESNSRLNKSIEQGLNLSRS